MPLVEKIGSQKPFCASITSALGSTRLKTVSQTVKRVIYYIFPLFLPLDQPRYLCGEPIILRYYIGKGLSKEVNQHKAINI